MAETSWRDVDSARGLLREALQRAGHTLRTRIEVEDVETAVEIVGLGLADSVLPRGAVEQLAPRLAPGVGWVSLRRAHVRDDGGRAPPGRRALPGRTAGHRAGHRSRAGHLRADRPSRLGWLRCALLVEVRACGWLRCELASLETSSGPRSAGGFEALAAGGSLRCTSTNRWWASAGWLRCELASLETWSGPRRGAGGFEALALGARAPQPTGGTRARAPQPTGGARARAPQPTGGARARAPQPTGGVWTRHVVAVRRGRCVVR